MNGILHDLSPVLVARAYDANQLAFWTLFRDLPQVVFHNNCGIIWFETGVPHFIFNRIVQSRSDLHQILPTLAKIIGSFQQRQWPFLWHVGPSFYSNNQGEILEGYGLAKIETNPVMAVDLLGINEVVLRTEQMDIMPVRTPLQLEQWLRIVEFGASEEIICHWLTFYSSLCLTLQSPLRLYLGYLGNQPVTTCALFLGGGVVWLGFVATLRPYRRQGLATEMTFMALREARNQGYRLSVLTASQRGITLYNRIGFQTYGTFILYQWSPTRL